MCRRLSHIFFTVYLFSLLALLTASCNSPAESGYAHYEIIDRSGWAQDEEIFFCLPDLPKDIEYDVLIALRMDKSIRYKEIPIGFTIETPSRKIHTMVLKISTDGKMSKSSGYNLIEHNQPVFESMTFKEKGGYTYSVRHLSEDSLLHGIIEVGMIARPKK